MEAGRRALGPAPKESDRYGGLGKGHRRKVDALFAFSDITPPKSIQKNDVQGTMLRKRGMVFV